MEVNPEKQNINTLFFIENYPTRHDPRNAVRSTAVPTFRIQDNA